jgi:acetyl esterase/lipase
MPSYPLAPDVSIPEITESIKRAIEGAAQEVVGPIVLTGHSAGGHLVARMLCEDGLKPEVAARVQHVVPISPLTDLRPLLQTSMNAQLQLTEISAQDESPMLRSKHYPAPVTVWAGAEERPAFLDQARWLAESWPDTTFQIDAGRHHFDVIDGLEHAESPLMNTLLG